MTLQLIYAADYGLRPGEMEDGSVAALRALAACRNHSGCVLQFEPGVYHFHPEHAREAWCWISNNDAGLKRIAFPVFGFENLTIDGRGAEFIFHGAITPFVLDHARDITIRNLTIDWAEPCTLTADITDVTEDEISLTVRPDCRYRLDQGRLLSGGPDWETAHDGFIELDPQTLAPAYRTGDCWKGDWAATFEEVAPHRLRFQAPAHRVPRSGNHLVFLRGDRNNPAIFVTESAQITLDDVNIYRAPAMGVIAQRSADLTLNRVNVLLRPGTDRTVSATADASHFVGCRGTVTLKDCLFESQLDDPTNVHGIYAQVLQRLSDRELILGRMHSQQKGVPFAGPGDCLRFAAPDTMNGLGDAEIGAVQEVNATETLVTLAAPLPSSVIAGTVAENLTWTPDLLIQNCTARRNRARGFLISTPGRVVVEDCTLSPGGAGILIPGESEFWFESGAVCDVTIRGNRFVDCCTSSWGRACIDITPHIPRLAEREDPFHRNIMIEGNRFDTFDHGILAVWSVEGLTFRDNHIQRTHAHAPFGGQTEPLEFKHCRNVVVEGNRGVGDESAI